jgi:hypothetical protein
MHFQSGTNSISLNQERLFQKDNNKLNKRFKPSSNGKPIKIYFFTFDGVILFTFGGECFEEMCQNRSRITVFTPPPAS